VAGYIADIVRATREHAALQYGASPRASIGLMRAAQGLSGLRGRSFVLPDDVKKLTGPVLGHRLILREEERLRGTDISQIVEDILKQIPVPVGE
jgi:MoxR-like ATPase